MYSVDEHDIVALLDDVPQSSIGAPLPVVLATEHSVVVAYLLEGMPGGWDGTWVRTVDLDSEDESVAVVSFSRPYAHMLGPPNDEAFSGHPLASRGLDPYGAFCVEKSSWLRILERMNRVHEYHRPEQFDSLRHFILTFHDSTFECVAGGYSVSVHRGPLSAVLPVMMARMRERT